MPLGTRAIRRGRLTLPTWSAMVIKGELTALVGDVIAWHALPQPCTAAIVAIKGTKERYPNPGLFKVQGSNTALMVVLTGIRSHTRKQFFVLERRVRQQQRRTAEPETRQLQVRLSPTDAERLVSAYQAGARTTDLAKQFGVHRNTVQRVLKVHGVDLRRRRARDC